MNLVSLLMLPAIISLRNDDVRFVIAGVCLVVLIGAVLFSKRKGGGVRRGVRDRRRGHGRARPPRRRLRRRVAAPTRLRHLTATRLSDATSRSGQVGCGDRSSDEPARRRASFRSAAVADRARCSRGLTIAFRRALSRIVCRRAGVVLDAVVLDHDHRARGTRDRRARRIRRRRRGSTYWCTGAGRPWRTSMSASSRSGTLSGIADATDRAVDRSAEASAARAALGRRVVQRRPEFVDVSTSSRRSAVSMLASSMTGLSLRARSNSVRAADVHGMPSTSSRSSSSITRLSCTTSPSWRVRAPPCAGDLDRRRFGPMASPRASRPSDVRPTPSRRRPARSEHVTAATFCGAPPIRYTPS